MNALLEEEDHTELMQDARVLNASGLEAARRKELVEHGLRVERGRAAERCREEVEGCRGL